jgi:hypothetical protein
MKMILKPAVIVIAIFAMMFSVEAEAGIIKSPSSCRKEIHAPRRNALSRGSRMARALAKQARKPICSNIGRRDTSAKDTADAGKPADSYSLNCVKDECCSCNTNATCEAKNNCCYPRAADNRYVAEGTAPWIVRHTRIENRLPMLQEQTDRSSTYGYRPHWPAEQNFKGSAQDDYKR